jgi:hypothetical protein
MKKEFDGPFVSAFNTDPDGVIKQELITFRVHNGYLQKETTTRTFNTDQSDWHDTRTVEPLVEVDLRNEW